MSASIDYTIPYRNYNTVKMVAPATHFSYVFSVKDMTAISNSLHVYSTTALASAVRAKTRFYNASGITISVVNHSFAVTTSFEWIKIENITVPVGAEYARFELHNTVGTYWAGGIKSESGAIATDFTVNYSGQLTKITASGVYTGLITAEQVVLSSGTLGNTIATINSKILSLTSTTETYGGLIETNSSQLTALGLRVKATEDMDSAQNTKITAIKAGEINLSATTGGVLAGMNITSSTLRSTSGTFGVQISGNSLYHPIYVGSNSFATASAKFYVTWAGKLYAQDVDITGKITATDGSFTGAVNATSGSFRGNVTATTGEIGGFSIADKVLRATNGTYGFRLSANSSICPIYIGDNNFNVPGKFAVGWDGALYAENAEIKGTVKAGSIINGSLNNTTGRHDGTTYGTGYGAQYGLGYGSQYGSVYSSAGSLGGSSFASETGAVRFGGHIRTYGGVSADGTLIIGGAAHISGKLYVEGSLVSSDARLKTDIRESSSALIDELYNVKIKQFTYKKSGTPSIGVIAQDIARSQNIEFSELVVTPHEGYLNVNYTNLNTLAIMAIQDLNKRLKALEGVA